MRVEPFTVDSVIHVTKRGARGMPIVRDLLDRKRFLRILKVMNDEYFDEDWDRQLGNTSLDYRPDHWPECIPLVDILAYTLMPNHFHLLIKVRNDRGVSKYMQKVSQSMSLYSNEKYSEKGSLFQGAYRARTIDTDRYLQYVLAYIIVKNTFELYPKGGITGAEANIDAAWSWALTYEYSSFRSYVLSERNSVIAERELAELAMPAHDFKSFAFDVISGRQWEVVAFE